MSFERNAAGKVAVPDDLRDLLLEFTISYLLEHPDDLIEYAVEFFTRLRDNRQNLITRSNAQTCSSTPDESVEEGTRPPQSIIPRPIGLSISPTQHHLSKKHTFLSHFFLHVVLGYLLSNWIFSMFPHNLCLSTSPFFSSCQLFKLP